MPGEIIPPAIKYLGNISKESTTIREILEKGGWGKVGEILAKDIYCSLSSLSVVKLVSVDFVISIEFIFNKALIWDNLLYLLSKLDMTSVSMFSI